MISFTLSIVRLIGDYLRWVKAGKGAGAIVVWGKSLHMRLLVPS